MNRISVIFSHGEKGGVGKTAVASALIEILTTEGKKVAIVEGDESNPDVQQRYAATVPALKKVRLADPSEYQKAINELVGFIAECADDGYDVVVVNMPAGAYSTVDVDIEILKMAIESIGADARVVISSGNTDQSIARTAKIAHEGIGTLGKYVVLAPEFFKDESLLHKLSELGLGAANYPRISPDVMQIILDHPRTTLTQMVDQFGPIKSPIHRIRISTYLRQAKNALMPVLVGLVDK